MKTIHSNQNIKIVIQTIFFTFIGMVLASSIMKLLIENGVTWLGNSVISNILLELIILAIQLIIVRRHYKKSVIKELCLSRKNVRWSRIVIIFLLGSLIVVVSFLILAAVRVIRFEGTGFELLGNRKTVQFLLSRFIQMLVVATAEEVCFRGVIANHLNKQSGKAVSILGSAIVFTIFHCMVWQGVTQITDIFVMGLILGMLYMRSRSLYDAIAFHFAINFITNIFGMEGEPGTIILSFGNAYSEVEVVNYLFGVMTILGAITFIRFLQQEKSSR